MRKILKIWIWTTKEIQGYKKWFNKRLNNDKPDFPIAENCVISVWEKAPSQGYWLRFAWDNKSGEAKVSCVEEGKVGIVERGSIGKVVGGKHIYESTYLCNGLAWVLLYNNNMIKFLNLKQ